MGRREGGRVVEREGKWGRERKVGRRVVGREG